jgi:hypothetical protein
VKKLACPAPLLVNGVNVSLKSVFKVCMMKCVLEDHVAYLMEKIADLIQRTLHSKLKGSTHWSTRTLADQTGVSHMTIARIWRTFGLKPHRSKTFKLSTDPFFVEKFATSLGYILILLKMRSYFVLMKKASVRHSSELNRHYPWALDMLGAIHMTMCGTAL